MKKTKKAFTLVELLVVIAILAILATVSILGYTSFTKKAKESNATSEMAQFYDYMLAQTLDGNDVFIELEAEVPAVTELKFAIGDVIYVKSTAPDYDGETKLVKGTDYELESKGDFTNSYTIQDGDKAIIGEVKVAAKAKVEAKGINFHYNSAENKIVVTNTSDNAHMSGFQAKLKEKYDNDVAFTGTFSWKDNKLVYNYQDVEVNFGK